MSLPPPIPRPRAEFSVDALRVRVYDDRSQLGRAAAADIASAIAAKQASSGVARVVFAAAPSQDEFLKALVADPSIDWSRVIGFHMDEYLGIGPDHPASFRRYLNEHLFRLAEIPRENLRLIPGERAERPLRTFLEYEEALRGEPPDVVCAGIGENGHLAFNDPPVADFLDLVAIKVVRLDPLCREQQVNDGCFATLKTCRRTPTRMTVPALVSTPVMSVVVPGPRKADAVLNALKGPIQESCPASALRRHPGAVLYLDRESARSVI
ncbi:MAG: 6-phosphogluconolactonase [Isosphaeraceae bacterium]